MVWPETILGAMLTEQSCKQLAGEPARRWLADEYFDLFIWNGANGGLLGFQLCYDVSGQERALTWMVQEGFSHAAIDSGESNPGANYTPVLLPVGHFPSEIIRCEFEARSREMDPQIREWVWRKLLEYGASDQTREW